MILEPLSVHPVTRHTSCIAVFLACCESDPRTNHLRACFLEEGRRANTLLGSLLVKRFSRTFTV
jgi:hypothetical protein